MTRIRNVRQTTKFKRSIKAISPVIATLLMIAIAVVASLVVYAWVTGYMGNTTSKAGKAIQIQSYAISGSNLVVYVQNVGQGDVELNKDQSVYINSNLVPITLPATATIPINAQDTVELTLPLPSDYVQGHSLNIKVTTTDGTFMTATGIPKTTNPTTPATTYAVTFELGTGGLSINPTGTQTVGGTIAITATENTGYHFTSWSSSTGSITFGDANLASTSATINGAGTITANFAADTVQYSVTFALGANGATISPTAGAHSYDAGSSVPITATASSGYHFTSWSSSTGSITFGDANLASTSATINGAGTITANFAADTVQYSVTFALGANGATISPTAGAHSYDAGSSVPITATASSGYHFTSWSSSTGSITFGDANLASTSATINGAGTITANFAADTVQQQVTYVSAGTGSGSTNSNPTPAYPSGLQANDLILLQVTVRGDSTPTITPPSGFALLRGPDATGGQSSRVTQWIYYKFSTGSETGTGTVTITGTNYDRAARMYAFRNVALTSFTEGASFGIGDDDVILAQSVTTLGTKRLAISFVAVQSNIAVDSFTGETGGDWTEAVSEFPFNGDDDLSMQLQTATMATAGTIQNGSYDTGSNSYRWVVTGFALKPA